MNSHFTSILNKLTTTEDAEVLTSQIDSVLQNLYSTTSISINQQIDQNIPKEIGAAIKKSFLEHGMSFEHHEELKSFFVELKSELSRCKVMILTLAYRPPEDHLRRLKKWCIQNISDSVIFEVQYEPTLVAGAIIILNGRYIDLSAKKQLDIYFQKNSGQTLTKP